MASVTAGAALKKIATYILTDKKGLKIVGMIVGIVLFIVLLPVLLLIGLFGGTLNFDTESLNQMQLDSQKAITSKWDEIESKMTESGFERITMGVAPFNDLSAGCAFCIKIGHYFHKTPYFF